MALQEKAVREQAAINNTTRQRDQAANRDERKRLTDELQAERQALTLTKTKLATEQQAIAQTKQNIAAEQRRIAATVEDTRMRLKMKMRRREKTNS